MVLKIFINQLTIMMRKHDKNSPTNNKLRPTTRSIKTVPTGVFHNKPSISGSIMPVMSPVKLAPLNKKPKIVAIKPRTENTIVNDRVCLRLNTNVTMTVPVDSITPGINKNFVTIAAKINASGIAIQL